MNKMIGTTYLVIYHEGLIRPTGSSEALYQILIYGAIYIKGVHIHRFLSQWTAHFLSGKRLKPRYWYIHFSFPRASYSAAGSG